MRPLQDIRIIAIEQYGAGPFGTLHLADMGADIIKIEDPRAGGDVGRYVPPFQNGEDSLFFETFNRNKRSLSLDITTQDGRQVFEDLVKVSDAVYSNLRGDVPQRLRICYDDLKHLNPAIVCCSLTGFGMTGPRQTSPGYDYLLQGLAGWMSLTGEPDAPPTKSGLSLVDFSGGYVGALSLMIGLHAARRDGMGMDCDVSLFDTAINMLSYPATWHLSAGFEPQRTSHSAHPSVVPFQNFETADGWIVVACPKEKFWQQLAETLDRPDLATDDRFSTFAARHANSTELLTILKALFQGQPSDYWLTRLQAAGIPCAPVNSVADALTDPHTKARQMIAEVPHPHFGTVQQPASPVKVGRDRPPYRRAPRRHEDAPAILADLLQYSAAKIADLTEGGAFGSPDSPSSP